MNPNAIAGTATLAIFNDPKIGTTFTSFSPVDIEGKKLMYNAINSPDHRLSEFINTPICLRDVVVSKVELADTNKAPEGWEDVDTKKREGFRVVIIDCDGKSYTATSTGIYNSVSTLRTVFGTLHFDDGINVIVKQISTKNGKTLTLALAD